MGGLSCRLVTLCVPSIQPTVTDCAYLAGIIDGEGSIGAHFHKSSGAWMTQLVVTNTNHALMDWLAERWLGNVIRCRPGTGGTKPTYFWQVTNRRVVPVLEDALPYLVLKREHAELALEWAAGCQNHGRRGYPPEVKERRLVIVERMRELNRRGPVAA